MPVHSVLMFTVEGRRFPSTSNRNVFVFCHVLLSPTSFLSWQYISSSYSNHSFIQNICSCYKCTCLVFYSPEWATVRIFVNVSMLAAASSATNVFQICFLFGGHLWIDPLLTPPLSAWLAAEQRHGQTVSSCLFLPVLFSHLYPPRMNLDRRCHTLSQHQLLKAW